MRQAVLRQQEASGEPASCLVESRWSGGAGKTGRTNIVSRGTVPISGELRQGARRHTGHWSAAVPPSNRLTGSDCLAKAPAGRSRVLRRVRALQDPMMRADYSPVFICWARFICWAKYRSRPTSSIRSNWDSAQSILSSDSTTMRSIRSRLPASFLSIARATASL